MDSPLDAFPSEASDSLPEIQTTDWFGDEASESCPLVPAPAPPPPPRRRSWRGAAHRWQLAVGAASFPAKVVRWTVALWQRPVPVPAYNERVSSVFTAAVTSASVSLLMMWLWGQGRPPGTESLNAASTSGEEAQAPESEAVLGTLVVNAPLPAPAPTPPTRPLARKASPISSAPRLARSVPPVSRAPEPSGLVVITEPEGARVTINGLGWGTTPLTVRSLPSRSHRIRVTKSGYQAEERVVGANGARATGTLRIVLRELHREAPRF